MTALSGTDHEVHYLRLENVSVAQEQRPVPAGVQILNWQGGRKHWWGVNLFQAKRQLRAVLRQVQPDLVHAGPIRWPAFLTALIGYHPLVSMSWGSDLLWDARRGPGRWSARYTLARTDVLVCDCEPVRQQALRLGMDPQRIVVFPWGVDLDHYSPAGPSELRRQLGWESALVILSARGWEPLAGVEVLVRGFIQAARAHSQLRLLLLGDGSRSAEVRRLLGAAGLLDRVHLAGWIGPDRLPEAYRAADLYVSASYSDGSSISLLEAMACGLPALVSDIPGNREWVQPEQNGWWFRVGDADALAHKLGQAVAQRERLAPLGSQARQVAEARADWRSNFPKLLQAYELARSAG